MAVQRADHWAAVKVVWKAECLVVLMASCSAAWSAATRAEPTGNWTAGKTALCSAGQSDDLSAVQKAGWMVVHWAALWDLH